MKAMMPTTRVVPMTPVDCDVEASADSAPSASMLEVLWRHRWIFAAAVVVCLAIAGVYLVYAPRIYRSTAELYIAQNRPQVINEHDMPAAPSEGFINAQADVMQSTPVLLRALDAINYQGMKTFAGVNGDPITWLRNGGAFSVEAEHKSDTLTVSMDSPSPQEATVFVKAVVDSFVTEQSTQDQRVGTEMMQILRSQMAEVEQQRQATREAMLKLRVANNSPSLREDANNDVLNRLTDLSKQVSTSQIEVDGLEARQQSAKAILSSPESIAAYVQAQQAEARDPGDAEYRDLRSKLSQTNTTLALDALSLGENHPRIKALRVYKQTLEAQITEKEQAIAAANLATITRDLTDGQQKLVKLQGELDECKRTAMGRNAAAASYAALEAELARLDQKSTLLDGRMVEISGNTKDAGALSVRVLDPARDVLRPIKPNKTQTMGVALLAGLLLGSGFSLLVEWRGGRVSSPIEVQAMLRTPVVGIVPRITARLSPAARGQLVHLDAHSSVAEAYRSIRTTLQLGLARDARTILIASPMSGDGKSTAASNLALAFAQNGCRTLLLDCDLRNPMQHAIFGLDGESGLTTVITGEQKLHEAVYQTPCPGLHVMPCGPTPGNPSELLGSPAFATLMDTLCKRYDRIIIDSPPLCSVTDARILAATCDATLLVLRMNQSIRDCGVDAIAGLATVGARLVGAIANAVSPSNGHGYGYGYGYGYGNKTRHEGAVRALTVPLAFAASEDSREVQASVG